MPIMSLYKAFNATMERGFVPYRRTTPAYKTLAEEAKEFEKSKESNTAQITYILHRINEIEKALERLETGITQARIEIGMPRETDKARIISPEEQIQRYYYTITNEEDRKLIMSRGRDAQTVEYRTKIINKLIKFGATISTIARMMCRDHGTIIHLVRTFNRKEEEKRKNQAEYTEKDNEKLLTHRITRTIRRKK